MSAKINITINSNTKSQQQLLDAICHNVPNSSSKLIEHVGINIGSARTIVAFSNLDSVSATGTVTLTNASISADDTVSIGGVTFTAKASGSIGDQFNIGGSATITAASMAVAINASANIDHSVLNATSAAGVLTIKCLIAGTVGNYISVSTSNGTGFVVSGAALTGGVNETSIKTLSFNQ